MINVYLRSHVFLPYLTLLFFMSLALLSYFVLRETWLIFFFPILLFMLLSQAMLSFIQIKRMTGSLSYFHKTKLVIWRSEQWILIRSPLFFRGMVILTLYNHSTHSTQNLMMMKNQFTLSEWHSLLFNLKK